MSRRHTTVLFTAQFQISCHMCNGRLQHFQPLKTNQSHLGPYIFQLHTGIGLLDTVIITTTIWIRSVPLNYTCMGPMTRANDWSKAVCLRTRKKRLKDRLLIFFRFNPVKCWTHVTAATTVHFIRYRQRQPSKNSWYELTFCLRFTCHKTNYCVHYNKKPSCR